MRLNFVPAILRNVSSESKFVMDKIRVLITDDHPMVRQGIRTFLERQADIEIVGEAATGTEALARTRELVPDLVLMDLKLPAMDGVTATREIKARYPNVRVIVLTAFDDDELILSALQAGAAGYLLKEIPAEGLVNAIRAAARGETPLAPQVTQKLVETVRQPRADQDTKLASLSEREREILSLLAQGLSNREIAARLAISDKTVKFHVSNILEKLHLSDRTQAALFAAKHGLIPPD